MSETSHEPIHLNVLPNSGKVDQLRKELITEGHTPVEKAAAQEQPTKNLNDRTPVDLAIDPTKTIRQKLIEGKVIAAIQTIYDPEIPINIYELGLIYQIDVSPDDRVKVKMTLTAPGCPVAGSLPAEVEKKIEAIDDVKSAEVELVWEPPWDKSRMSESALLDLGLL